MDTALVIFIAALITIAIVRARVAANASTVPTPQPKAAPAEGGATVASLMQAGQKIQAIKLYREQTGVGLAEAKDAVEAMARGEFHPLAPAHLDTVDNLIQAGHKIAAIKLYREQTGVGLKEAKDAVEAMARGEAPPQVAMPPEHSDTLENLIRAGHKIEAIKLYREQTGVGLKDAKDHVEALAQQLLRR